MTQGMDVRRPESGSHCMRPLKVMNRMELFGSYFFCFFFFFSCFLGPHPWHMEVPGLGVKSELQLLATATATPDQSYVCDTTAHSDARYLTN